jgi:hypothetical protein
MASQLQSQDVFRRCMEVVGELEGQKRDEDSTAILRALSFYLDALPAMPDKSCKAKVDGHLAKTYARVREKEMKGRR